MRHLERACKQTDEDADRRADRANNFSSTLSQLPFNAPSPMLEMPE